MLDRSLQPSLSRTGRSLSNFVARKLLGTAVLAAVTWCGSQAQELPTKPVRLFTIRGEVSLPDGRPAVHALVTLSTSGAQRQTYTGEEGRFEFPPMESGGYRLQASSVEQPNLVSESLDTDTTRTATDKLTVHLTLHPKSSVVKKSKPGLVSVADADEQVPKEARKAFKQGLKLRGNAAPDEALKNFSRAIELYPEYFQAFAERGDTYVALRKLPEAAADFGSALKLNARYGPALRGSGYCRLEKREFTEAIEYFERAISVEPDKANTYLLLGIANLELDRREPAKLALQKALTFSDYSMPRAHIYLANLFALDHQYLQAADELHKYLEAEPAAGDAAELRKVEAQWRARATTP